MIVFFETIQNEIDNGNIEEIIRELEKPFCGFPKLDFPPEPEASTVCKRGG